MGEKGSKMAITTKSGSYFLLEALYTTLTHTTTADALSLYFPGESHKNENQMPACQLIASKNKK